MNQPQRPSGAHEGNASPEVSAPSDAEDDTQGEESTASANRKQRRPYGSRIKQAWTRTSISNKLIVAFTAAIAVSNFFYVLYARRQWAVMSGTLAEVARQYPELKKSANAAHDAVDNSIQQFRVDERAWLELESFQNKPVEMTPALKRAFPGLRAFAQGVTIRNYGRSIARNISVRLNMTNAAESFGKNSEKLRITEEALRLGRNTAKNKSDWVYIFRAPIATSLAPGSTTNATMPFAGLPHHAEGGKDVFPYIVGRIDYTDAFGVPHWKTFCFQLTETDRSYCETGNDEDSNPESLPKPN